MVAEDTITKGENVMETLCNTTVNTVNTHVHGLLTMETVLDIGAPSISLAL